MKSPRQRNMGWGLSLVILCVAVILAPRSYAYDAGHKTGEYGTVIGIVGGVLIIGIASLLVLLGLRIHKADVPCARISVL